MKALFKCKRLSEFDKIITVKFLINIFIFSTYCEDMTHLFARLGNFDWS